MTQTTGHIAKREDWVDLSKGLTILLVVIMHSVYGVERALESQGWMHPVLAFATPFRMPVFFAVAGLFAANAIRKNWLTFLDKKLVHFGYFYILWMTIEFVFKTPFFVQHFGIEGTGLYYLLSFVQPFGLLWFIYLLPVYFIVLRLTAHMPVFLQLVFAVACKMLLTSTGISIVDFFAKYYVFFLVGHTGRAVWFATANWVARNIVISAFLLTLWAVLNGFVVAMKAEAYLPVAIGMGVLGFIAVLALMSILPHFRLGRALARILRFCGQNSLPIYLGFFLPMGISRLLMLKFGNGDPGLAAFMVALSAIFGAIAMHKITLRLGIARFLYERPQWARLKAPSRRSIVAAQ